MKMKKAIASVAAMAMAVSTLSAFAMSASAISAGATTIDFEDGDCSFVYMNVDAGADNSVLSVEEYNGSKQLKVDVQDSNNVPKVWFDLDKICSRDTSIQINSIELDLTFVPKNAEEAVGWAGGAIGAAGGFDQADPAGTQINPSWSDGQWACEDENAYTPGMAATVHVTRKFLLPSTKYSAEGTNPFFGIMRWASEVDYVMYVDNVVLKDKSGAALALGVTAAAEETEAAVEETAAAETEAAVEEEAVVEEEAAVEEEVVVETEAAPAVTEAAPAAPAADAATPVAPTGNTAAAAIAAVMAVAGAAALISKRK